ncbi:Sporulation protein kinase pit1 [Bienertia sinuspersici]
MGWGGGGGLNWTGGVVVKVCQVQLGWVGGGGGSNWMGGGGLGEWYAQRYRVKEVIWNESEYERAKRRAMWMDILRNDRICQEHLHLDIKHYKECLGEIVSMFLHILAHDLKNRTIQALFAHAKERTLDGTYIKMTVLIEDRPHYRDRKRDISTNILATSDPNLHFTYDLLDWEGSTSDPKVLPNALRRPNGPNVPKIVAFCFEFLMLNVSKLLTRVLDII